MASTTTTTTERSGGVEGAAVLAPPPFDDTAVVEKQQQQRQQQKQGRFVLPLSKQERGRLKKLKKRARWCTTTNSNNNQEDVNNTGNNKNEKRGAATTTMTGITTASDWNELQQLMHREDMHGNKHNTSATSSTSNATNATILADCFSSCCSVHVHRKQENGADGETLTSWNPPVVSAASHRQLLRHFVQTVMDSSVGNEETPRITPTNGGSHSPTPPAQSKTIPCGKTKKRNRKEMECPPTIDLGPNPTNNNSFPSSSAGDPHKSRHSALSAYPWASVHNAAVVSHVAVLDLAVDTNTQTAAAQVWMARIRDQAHRVHGRSVAALPTEWFPIANTKDQSNRHQHNQPCESPQSISDALLYDSSVLEESPPLHQQARNNLDSSQRKEFPTLSMEELDARLDAFLLTMDEKEQEEYPFATTSTVARQPAQKLTDQTFLKPEEISLETARAFVAHYQTTITQSPHTDADDESQRTMSYVAPCLSSTNHNTHVHSRRIFALDCEMVKTRHGLELARVTLCKLDALQPNNDNNEHDTNDASIMSTSVIFDTLVRPVNPVLNYLTQYSGMTAAILNPQDDNSRIVVQLPQVQAALLHSVHPDDIVIGHSLENDLYACRWVHTTVIDTAILFPKREKQPQDPQVRSHRHKFSLRHLSAVLLRKQIQNASSAHCSIEDAVTAMELVVQRAKIGPSFNMSSMSQSVRKTQWLTPISKHVTTVAVGPVDWLHRHILSGHNNNSSSAVHALTCESVHHDSSNSNNDQAMVRWLTGPKRRAGLAWARYCLPSPESDTRGFDQILRDLLSKVSSQTIILVAIQAGFDAAQELSQTRRIRRNPRSTIPWFDEDEESWKKVLFECHSGFVLWIGGVLPSGGNI